MSIRNIAIGALIAASVVAVPVVAQASKARHTSVAKVAAVRKRASHAGPDTSALIIGALAVGGAVAGIALASSSNSPSSP